MFVHHQGFGTLLFVLERLKDGIDPVLKNVPIIPGLTGTIGHAPIMAHKVNLYPNPNPDLYLNPNTNSISFLILPTTLTLCIKVEFQDCKSMVCRHNRLYLFDDREWRISGFVALQATLMDDLEGMDSVLRYNTLYSTTRQRARISAFVEKISSLTVDGKHAHPLFYYKRRVRDNWEVGRVKPIPDVYPTDGHRLAYTHLWVVCHSCVFRYKCCLAVLVAALRYGMASLHPKYEGEGFRVSCLARLDLLGQYTLSGMIRVKKKK
jgi:hypothetical protein